MRDAGLVTTRRGCGLGDRGDPRALVSDPRRTDRGFLGDEDGAR